MSYQIYYGRAFVRVGDKFIPMINSGSNNCWDYNYSGRMIPEKNWNVLNWKRENQFMFTEDEIKEIARYYDQYNQESGMMFKSRNQCFAPGEFERWVVNGLRSAYTIEEYVEFGNRFYVLDYSPDKTSEWEKHPFRTTEELHYILDKLSSAKSLEIKLEDNRSVNRPVTRRAKKSKLRASELAEYYVLKGDYSNQPIYLVGLKRSGGFQYVSYCPCSSIKVFKTEKDARKYLDKYHDRLVRRYNFTPERVTAA